MLPIGLALCPAFDLPYRISPPEIIREVAFVFIPILQIQKSKFRKTTCLAQVHTASVWPGQDWTKPDVGTPSSSEPIARASPSGSQAACFGSAGVLIIKIQIPVTSSPEVVTQALGCADKPDFAEAPFLILMDLKA